MSEQLNYGDSATPAFLIRGVTADLPSASAVSPGTFFYDESLSMMLVSSGSSWQPVTKSTDRLLSAAQGFKYEGPCSRSNCQSASIGTSGAQYYTLIPLFAGETITSLAVDCITAGATLTLVKTGLVSTTGTLLGASADEKAQFTSTGVKACPLTTPYTPTADGAAYAVIVVTHGGTGPNLVRMQSSVTPNAYSSNALPSGRRTGLSDISALVPADSTGPAFWFGVI